MDKRHILKILQGKDHKLGQLLDRARELDRIDRVLPHILGDAVASKVRTASSNRGRLLLVTPSAALATRLRMDAQALLSAINERLGTAFERMDVRVGQLPAPSRHRPDPARRSRRPRHRPTPYGLSDKEN